MSLDNRWLLPEGIEEISPQSAWRLEQLRRDLLDLYQSWGYQLVVPPFVEFLESLLTGTGRDLEMQTFKLVDPISGRQLGIRADMTPQVARINARANHALQRLCYAGTVLVTHNDGFGGSRSPLQFGAELYGHQGHESDQEIVSLLLASLQTVQINNVHLDLGHVIIFRSLLQQAGLNKEQEADLFDIMQRKSRPELIALLDQSTLTTTSKDMLLALITLNGNRNILSKAREQLAAANDDVHQALDYVERLATTLKSRYPNLPLHFDLAELRGYHYHTGLVFAAYVPGHGQEIARGGRYDGIGQAFGRSRPATGFSSDLKTLLTLNQPPAQSLGRAIYAPALDEPELIHKISELRTGGECVIYALPGTDDNPTAQGCDRILAKRNGSWQVMFLESDEQQKR